MNILSFITSKYNKHHAKRNQPTYGATSVVIRGTKAYITSPQLLQTTEATEELFGKRHLYMWEGPVGTTGVMESWFLPELHFMLKELISKKLAFSAFSTIILIDELENTWVSDKAHSRINYRNIKRLLKWKPLPHQQNYIDHYEYSTSKYGLKGGLAAISPGGGKSLANGEPVLTPTGWVNIESLVVNDTVISSSGSPCKVTGVYPQGVRDLYRITFIDDTTVDCDGEHIWSVNNTLKTTKSMLLAGVRNEDNKPLYAVPLMREINGAARVHLGYDPMVMGKLCRNIDTGSIPTEYLYSSDSQRADLYIGLTGNSHHATLMYVTTSSKKMAYSAAELGRSLGKLIRISKNGNTYRVSELMHHVKYITDITPIDSGHATCISVDASDSLYVTRGYTVTHNTYTSIAIAEGLSMERVVVICPKPAIPDPWISSTKDLYKQPTQRVWASTMSRTPTKDDRWLICNYAYMEKMHRILSTLPSRKTMFIVDESHNLNEISAAQTNTYLRLVKRYSDEVIHLSGTPIKATIKELIPIMTAIDPRFTDETAKRFYEVLKHSHSNTILEMIHNRLNRMSYSVEKTALALKKPILVQHNVTIRNGERYTIATVQKDMRVYSKNRMATHLKNRPAAVKTYWRLADSLEHDRVVYTQFKRDFETIYSVTTYRLVVEEMRSVNGYEKTNILPRLSPADRRLFRSIRAVAKYPLLKTLGETLGNVLGKARINCNVDLAKKLDYRKIFSTAKGKCLFFSNHIAAVNAMATASKKAGYQPLMVYGEHVDNLPEIISTFRETDANPLGATYASLATAVPLTMVSDVYILDTPFRDYVLDQAISRAHRLGNDKQVYVHYIMLKTSTPNINDRSLELAEWSGSAVAAILNIEPNVEYPETVSEEITE